MYAALGENRTLCRRFPAKAGGVCSGFYNLPLKPPIVNYIFLQVFLELIRNFAERRSTDRQAGFLSHVLQRQHRHFGWAEEAHPRRRTTLPTDPPADEDPTPIQGMQTTGGDRGG